MIPKIKLCHHYVDFISCKAWQFLKIVPPAVIWHLLGNCLIYEVIMWLFRKAHKKPPLKPLYCGVWAYAQTQIVQEIKA